MKTNASTRTGRIRLPKRLLRNKVLTIRLKGDELRELRIYTSTRGQQLSLWARKVLFEKAGIEP